MTNRNRTLRTLGHSLAFVLACSPLVACDSGDKDEQAEAGDKAGASAASEMATKATAEVAEMKAELAKGEDIKYGCAGNLAQYDELNQGSDADKAAYQAMLDVCFVEAPKALIADLRAKMEKGELSTMDTVDLSTLLDDDKFPKDGEAAKVAEEAKMVLEVEIPAHELKTAVAEAKKEKEAGDSVSMGCIKAKQIVEKHGAKLEGNEAAKATVADYKATCPEE